MPRKKRSRATTGPASVPQEAWNPLSIFLLSVIPWAFVWLPVGILFSGVMACLNWRRLGYPERNWQPLAIALICFVTPFCAYYLAHVPGFPYLAVTDPRVHPGDLRATVFAQIACWCAPSFALHSQREAWLEHVSRGGKAAGLRAATLILVPLGVLAVFFRLALLYAPLPAS